MEPIDRKTFLASAGAASLGIAATAPSPAQNGMHGTVFLSTWKWGIEANAKAASVASATGDGDVMAAISTRGEIGALSMNAAQPLQYALWRNGEGALHAAVRRLATLARRSNGRRNRGRRSTTPGANAGN